MINPELAIKIAELKLRSAKMSEGAFTFPLKDICFTKQYEFISDPHKLKALFCTRRAAKSYTGGLYLVSEALKYPNSNCLYIGLTRMSAKGIVWSDILKDINRKNDLGMEFNGSELTATFPNGSMIICTGADSQEDEMEKLLGKKYKLVVIDEAASFTVDLRRLIYGILKPATIDQGGSICLLGTSGNLTSGLFFDITGRKEPGWKLFTWSAFDNPHIAHQWQEELDDIKLNRPAFMETPLFRQWYLNEWVIDQDQLVYRFAYGRNEYTSLPSLHHTPSGKTAWQTVLGVDLGYDPDPSAFVIARFNEFDSTLYFEDCFKKKEMDVTDVANQIKIFQKIYDIDRVVIDGSNKQAVKEMQRRHDLSLTNADKREKVDFIQLMNAEFIQGKIKLSPKCQAMKDEYLNLIWDPKSLKKQEHPNCENHLGDASLYAWRFCYSYMAQKPKHPVNLKNQSEYVAFLENQLSENLEREVEIQERNKKNELADDLFGLDDDEIGRYFVNRRRS